MQITITDSDSPGIILNVLRAVFGAGAIGGTDIVLPAPPVPAPPPSPAALSPANPTPPPVVAPAPQWDGNTLDGDGLPWDERIHAGTKTKTQKGHWTRRKGVDENVVASVIAQMRERFPPAQSVLPTTPPPAAPPAAPPVAANPPPPPAAPTPPPPPVAPSLTLSPDGQWWLDVNANEWRPIATLPSGPAIPSPETTWPDVSAAMNRAIGGGKIDMAGINGIANRHGAANFALLAAMPNTWPLMIADLQPYCA